MKKITLIILSLYCSLLIAQNNNTLVQRNANQHNRGFQQFGTSESRICGNTELDMEVSEEFRMSCSEFYDGYGTNGWQPFLEPDNCNIDATCDIPVVPYPNYNGGLYRVPVHFTIFEDHNDAGFIPLSDANIDALLTSANEVYRNANIQFYEAKEKLRVESPDVYDFHKSTADPLDNILDNAIHPIQTNLFNFQVSDDINNPYYTPNIINLYFVKDIDGTNGSAGFAYYPTSSKQNGVFRYDAPLNTIVHEFGHLFGLLHTHGYFDDNNTPRNVDGTPNGHLYNVDCLTTGDRTCDTWPDPNLGFRCQSPYSSNYPNCTLNTNSNLCYNEISPNCPFSNSAYECINGTALDIDPNDGQDCNNYTSTILTQNFMSYNLFKVQSEIIW